MPALPGGSSMSPVEPGTDIPASGLFDGKFCRSTRSTQEEELRPGTKVALGWGSSNSPIAPLNRGAARRIYVLMSASALRTPHSAFESGLRLFDKLARRGAEDPFEGEIQLPRAAKTALAGDFLQPQLRRVGQ